MKRGSLAAVHVLGETPTERGRVLERLARDVLSTLGYDEFRTGSAPGRQVDLMARHRTEGRLAIAECKATTDPVGGDALNKFAGVLEVERLETPESEITGYFLATGGFTASARQQEARAGDSRFHMIDGEEMVNHLVAGRVVVDRGQALDTAAAVRGASGVEAQLAGSTLLASEHGWIWALFYRQSHGELRHVLVHGDGEPLDEWVASRLPLDARLDLRPGSRIMPVEPVPRDDLDRAHERYLQHLGREFGFVSWEGVTSDEHAATKRIPLEDTFVPLTLEVDDEGSNPRRVSVGEALRRHRHIAVLAPPGGGKSTLVKRLVTAYAFPDRRTMANDGLQDEDWFPLAVRCRELSRDVDRPLRESLETLHLHAELTEFASGFSTLVARRLQGGRALLLIDGLDEISDDGSRARFAKRLRTFIAAYPAVPVVVTTRPTGYRVVAETLQQVCAAFHLSELGTREIAQLTVDWHRAVIDDTDAVREDALALADSIVSTPHLQRLARIPLLLVTMLLVRRAAGDFPKKRSVLYARALEVLLATWNVEGHRPIDVQEAEPQLAWVAYEMTVAGEQQIPERDLQRLLRDARTEMPELFGERSIPVTEFTKRVEDRSSILGRAGHTESDGTIQAVFEFKHLAFQEYLTARAIAERTCSPAVRGADPHEILRPRLEDAAWREIVPLTATLCGRRGASPIMEVLLEELEARLPVVVSSFGELIGQCLIDDVPLRPDVADRACEALIAWFEPKDVPVDEILLSNLHGGRFRTVVDAGFRADAQPLLKHASYVAFIARLDGFERCVKAPGSAPERASRLALALYSLHSEGKETATASAIDALDEAAVVELARSSKQHEQLAGCRGAAVLGYEAAIAERSVAALVPRLVKLWFDGAEAVRPAAADALSKLPLVDRELVKDRLGQDLARERMPTLVPVVGSEPRSGAVIVTAYYLGRIPRRGVATVSRPPRL